MRTHQKYLVGLLLGLAALGGCAPRGTSEVPKSQSPATPTVPVMPAAAATSTLSPEDSAWQKVVNAAEKEGKVTLYATWVPKGGPDVETAFESTYKIDLEILNGRGAEFTERLKTERRIDQRVGDVTQGSAIIINNMKPDGLLSSVADELPALREKGVWRVEPTAFDPQDRANLLWSINERSAYVNTKLVKPEDVPKSWKDLLNQRWTNNMVLNDPNMGPGIYEAIVTYMENKLWDEDYVRALYRQKLTIPPNDIDALRMLSAGESHLSIVSADTFAAGFVQEGAPIQAIAIEGTALIGPATVAVLSGGPHPNASRVFVNWLLSANGQTAVGKIMGRGMVRKDVTDFRPKAIQAPATKYLLTTLSQNDKATNLFKQKWFDKLVGR